MTDRPPALPAYLVLDASTKTPIVGVMNVSGWESSARETGEALESLFRLTQRTLSESGRQLHDLEGMLFCAGPGSLLGLRLAAMAASAWRSLPELQPWTIRQYYSLELVASALQLRGEKDFHVLAPFRRDLCNHLPVQAGKTGALDVFSAEQIETLSGPRYFVPNGTLRTTTPRGVTELAYTLDSLPDALRQFPERFPEVANPRIHVPLAPEFARWSADRHR